jgi:T5SS/PEP-CTERM-associated repeat protein
VTLLAVVLSTAARANDWIGTISTDWYTAGNWDLNAIPISTDPVFFNTTTGIPSLINGGMVTVNGLYIGVGDKGVLTVANGAVLNSNLAYVGQMAGSSGAVTVTGVGSIWNAQGLVVGNDGVGTLAILNGGAVNTSVYEFSLADQSGNGTAIVDGAGSKLTASDFVVGNGGTGTLTVSNGGAVIGTTWISTIGHDVGAVGTVTVTGAGSTLSNVGDLFIGQNGSGTLTVANGGGVTVGGNIVLAYQPGSTGTLNIGGAAGAAAAAPGTVNTANIEFRAGTGAINFNHTGVGYVFAPAMSGFGTINQLCRRQRSSLRIRVPLLARPA